MKNGAMNPQQNLNQIPISNPSISLISFENLFTPEIHSAINHFNIFALKLTFSKEKITFFLPSKLFVISEK